MTSTDAIFLFLCVFQGGNLTENATGIICQPNLFNFAINTHLIDGIKYLQGRDGYTEFGWFVWAPPLTLPTPLTLLPYPILPNFSLTSLKTRQQGGGLCTRVSCEENSGIYVCNDNEYDIWVYYDVMAAYAQHIMDYIPSNPNATVCSVCFVSLSGTPPPPKKKATRD